MSDATHVSERKEASPDDLARQRKLEIFRSSLTFFGQLLIALSGLVISLALSAANQHREAEAKRVEHSLRIYEDIKDDLNSLFIFPCRVGNYDSMSPSAAGTLKRKLDKYFAINVAFISPDTYKAYKNFKEQFVRENLGPGKHFQFETKSLFYKIAYSKRREEYLKRGGTPDQAPQDVSDAELDEWFTNALPSSGQKIALSYAQLLGSFAGDAGYAESPDELARLFVCFYPKSAGG